MESEGLRAFYHNSCPMVMETNDENIKPQFKTYHKNTGCSRDVTYVMQRYIG